MNQGAAPWYNKRATRLAVGDGDRVVFQALSSTAYLRPTPPLKCFVFNELEKQALELPNGMAYNPAALMRGGAVWQLVGLITRRS